MSSQQEIRQHGDHVRLYRAAGWLTVAMIVLMLGQVAYFSLVPLPEGGAENWFALFNWNALAGFLSFELLMVLYALLAIPVSLAFFLALRDAPRPLAWGFLVLSLLSALAFVAARPMWEMFDLSRQFAGAANEGEALYLIEAGNRMLRSFTGPAFNVSYYAGALGGLLLGIALWRAPGFGRVAGGLRIASAVLDLGILIPGVGLYISMGSVLVLLVFNIVTARGFFRLAATAR